jgi:hypothetical protein
MGHPGPPRAQGKADPPVGQRGSAIELGHALKYCLILEPESRSLPQ